MKLSLDNLQSIQHSSKGHKHLKKCNFEEYTDKYKKSKIDTYRPAQAISFGGSALSAGSWFVKSKFVNGLTEFVNENEAAYNAIYSLIVAGILKPFFVLKTKGADEKDKQIIATKNFLQAFIGSFLGFTIGGTVIKKAIDGLKNNMKLIGTKVANNNGKTEYSVFALSKDDDRVKEIAKKALIKEHENFSHRFTRAKEAFKDNSGITDKLHSFFTAMKKNKNDNFKPLAGAVDIKAEALIKNLENKHLKILQKNPEFVDKLLESAKDTVSNSTLMDAFDSVWKNSTGAFTAVGKAMISSALLPGVMAFIFAKRNLEKAKEEAENTDVMLNNNLIFKTEKQKFKTMLDSQNTNKENGENLAFSGKLSNKVSDILTTEIEKIAMSKPGEAFVKKMNSLPGVLNKPSARMGDIESLGLTAYWLINTTASKKIEPSQKLGLNVHTALVTLVSSVSAFLIDTILDPLVKHASNTYKNQIQHAVNTALELKESASIDTVKTIETECKKLLGCDNIVKKLASVDLLDKETVEKAITDLSRNYSKKLSKLKSLTIFTLVVRFLVPVLLVKPSNKLKQKISQRKKEKEERLKAQFK